MRKNRFLVSLVLIFLLFACDTGKKSSEETPSDAASKESTSSRISYSIKDVSDEVSDCKHAECTRIKINYPEFDSKTENASTLNGAVKAQLQQTISDFIMEAEGNESIEELTSMFISSYEEFKKSFPESQTAWYVETDAMVSASDDGFISLVFNTSSYTGGAHPNTFVEYLNLSRSGKVMSNIADFFTDRSQLKSIAEVQFRSKYNLSETDPLSEKGFIFDNDEFSLTDNFGFTDSAVIFYYNSYEIAPHSMGPTALLIPLSNLEGIFKFK